MTRMFGNTISSVPEKIDWTKIYKAKPIGFVLKNGRPIIKWKIYSGKNRQPKSNKGVKKHG